MGGGGGLPPFPLGVGTSLSNGVTLAHQAPGGSVSLHHRQDTSIHFKGTSPTPPPGCGMQMLKSNSDHKGTRPQSNKIRTKRSSVTLPQAPFAAVSRISSVCTRPLSIGGKQYYCQALWGDRHGKTDTLQALALDEGGANRRRLMSNRPVDGSWQLSQGIWYFGGHLVDLRRSAWRR